MIATMSSHSTISNTEEMLSIKPNVKDGIDVLQGYYEAHTHRQQAEFLQQVRQRACLLDQKEVEGAKKD